MFDGWTEGPWEGYAGHGRQRGRGICDNKHAMILSLTCCFPKNAPYGRLRKIGFEVFQRYHLTLRGGGSGIN